MMKINYKLMSELASKYRSQYEVEDFYGKLLADQLSRDTDMYWTYEKYGQFRNSAMKLVIEDNSGDYDVLLSKIEDALNSSGGKDNAMFTNHVAIYADDWYDENPEKHIFKYSNRLGDVSIYGLCEIFKFAVTKDYPTNIAFGNECEKKAKEYFKKIGYTSGWGGGIIPHGVEFDLGFATEEPMFDGLLVKFFKNGKVQFKPKKSIHLDMLVTLEKAIQTQHKYY